MEVGRNVVGQITVPIIKSVTMFGLQRPKQQNDINTV